MIFPALVAFLCTISPQEERALKEKIEKGSVFSYEVKENGRLFIHKSTWKDAVPLRTNFGPGKCSHCACKDEGLYVQNLLEKEGFKRHRIVSTPRGHCVGLTLAFMRYLKEHPPLKTACKDYLSNFKTDLKEVHAWSVNQPTHYKILDNPEKVKRFFEIATGRSSDVFYYLKEKEPNNGREAFFKAHLEALQEHTIYVAYREASGLAHVMLFYSAKERIFAFDTIDGLFEFQNIETLSAMYGKLFEKNLFDFIIAFPN